MEDLIGITKKQRDEFRELLRKETGQVIDDEMLLAQIIKALKDLYRESLKNLYIKEFSLKKI